VNRQSETRRLVEECQALVVVGGRDSGNTRRLADIGREAGLPTAAVEGPEELDSSFFEGVDAVGLAAGASTPTWQIGAVHQRLEAFGRSKGGSPAAFVRRFFRALALSNVYVGLGAGCLGLAMARAAGFRAPDYLFGLFFFFVQAMHLLNGFLDGDSSRHNDPDRANFLKKYRAWLVLSGLSSLGLALSAAYLAGPLVLALIGTLSLLGLIYAAPIPADRLIPERWTIRRLKDLPLSKTLSMASGWSALLILPGLLSRPPLLSADRTGLRAAAVLAGAVFIQVLCRTMMSDFHESLGDRLFGKKTPVTVLGHKGATWTLVVLLAVWCLHLALSARLLGFPWPVLPLTIFGPLYCALIFRWVIKSARPGGFRLDLLIDGQFLASGLSVLLWAPR
jgi:4-hydroxy-3-methylbut-2-enyl diphosphate reductase